MCRPQWALACYGRFTGTNGRRFCHRLRQKQCFPVLLFRGRTGTTRTVGACAKHMMIDKVLQTFFARPVAKFIFGGANVMARTLESGILRLRLGLHCQHEDMPFGQRIQQGNREDQLHSPAALTPGSGSPFCVASKRSHAEI